MGRRRRGVEVFVEPKTAVTETSVVLVAHDGEFTRRRIASPKAAQEFAHDNSLPIYDATLVGYPQRMRDYSRRQTILRERARPRRARRLERDRSTAIPGEPDRAAGQRAAMSASTASRVRTGTPVPPEAV